MTDEEIIRDAENHLKTDHPGFTYGKIKAPHHPYYMVNIGKNGNKEPEWCEWEWKNDIERLKK